MKSSLRSMRIFMVVCLVSFIHSVCTPVDVFSQPGTRRDIAVPNILGYVTLKCDLHMHTVFSDGEVWPVTRVVEAWQDGLDAIAITDHIEVQPHKDDIASSKNYNRSYEIALPAAQEMGLILIRGVEITRPIPPGHLNAVFITDANPLDTPNFEDVIKIAGDQGAFVFFNHPGWYHPDGKGIWYPVHADLAENGLLQGIEVVNEGEYYPEAQAWCLEKKLTMIGSSDIHTPIQYTYDFSKGEHRPMTLVFAKKKTLDSLKEALFARRTAVWHKNMLIGEDKYLRQLFNESIEIINSEVTLKGIDHSYIQIRNNSDIPFELAANGDLEEFMFPQNLTLLPGKTVLCSIAMKSGALSGKKKIRLPFTLKNLLTAPGKGLDEEFTVTVRCVPKETK